jgi:hypothetical protein
MKYATIEPSTSRQPDLDWSQVRETVRMLHLSVAQIDISLREGDDSIKTLSESFTSMIESVQGISKAAARLEAGEQNREVMDVIDDEGSRVMEKMQQSIVAFQFYDKLSQRLSHVSHALDALAQLVGDQSRLYNPTEWSGLQGRIRDRYSMREEQQMFDLLLSGASVEEALENSIKAIHEAVEDEIELF